jgi:hypothetical protein
MSKPEGLPGRADGANEYSFDTDHVAFDHEKNAAVAVSINIGRGTIDDLG